MVRTKISAELAKKAGEKEDIIKAKRHRKQTEKDSMKEK
jgi:hypothetical protein